MSLTQGMDLGFVHVAARPALPSPEWLQILQSPDSFYTLPTPSGGDTCLNSFRF